MGLLGKRLSPTRLIALGIGLVGLFFVAGSGLIRVWFFAGVSVPIGAILAAVGIAQTTILQTRVPPEVQGRIFATREFINNVTFLLTTVVIGLVGLATGVRTSGDTIPNRSGSGHVPALLLIIGVALLALGMAGWRMIRTLRPDVAGDGA